MRFRRLIVALLLLSAALVHAQGSSGALTGILRDPNGAVITGLDSPIFMTNSDTGERFTAAVSTDGSYTIENLPAGTYQLNIPIECCMYRSYDQEDVTIEADVTRTMDLALAWDINLGTIGDDPGMLSNDMRARAGRLTGPAPRTADGKPDFTGVWYNIPPDERPPPPAMQPWAAEMAQQLRDMGIDQNAGAYCLPQSAIPTTLPFPFKLVQTPDVMIHIVEFMTPGFRQIFLDGRDRPEFWNPAWMGHSVGNWEGDTLVIETVGFNEVTPGFGIHTENLRVVERFTRPDYGRLEIEITAEDPDAFTEPYVVSYVAELLPDEEILEFVCAENNKDPLHFGALGWKGRP